MILSVSRRTDIPAFYSDWFVNRLREKIVWVRNPMNYHSISQISMDPNVVDCIVFWSKNPQPMYKYLDEIESNYKFYFQYTINAYDDDIEPHLPELDKRLENFIYLAKRYGKEKVLWRYDPIIVTSKYNLDWHIKRFEYVASKLKDYTNACIFSFLDIYDINKNNLSKLGIQEISHDLMIELSQKIKPIADKNGIELRTCSENIDLHDLGIKKSCCIDPVLISNIINCKIKATKDKNQRESCGCVESIDIGQYNTCSHGCVYCYANYNKEYVKTNCQKHIKTSKLLLGKEEKDDKIHERKVKSLRELQMSFID